MKAWTYAFAPSAGWYWRSSGIQVLLLEQEDGRLEWRVVETGVPHQLVSPTYDCHKGQVLPREQYPRWLSELDDMGMDVGL